jgi:preprotein translocase subunit SecD
MAPGGTDKVYLHRDPLLTDDDIIQAHMVVGDKPGDFGVLIAFTAQGAEKMAMANRDRLDKPLALLLDGKVVAAQQSNRLTAEYCTFTGFSREAAERIAKAISLSSVSALINHSRHVKLEVLLAQREPSSGLTESVERNTLQKIYLFKEPLISNKDILEARVVKGYMDGIFDVNLDLTPEAGHRMARDSEANIGKLLAVLVNNRVVSAGYIIGKLSNPISIAGDFAREEAECVANALNRR